MVRQRLVIATLLFLGAFAVVAQLAWNTAESTDRPWFSTSISRDVYSTVLISATILVGILAALAAGLSGLAAREARALDLRLNILRDIEDTLDEILGSVAGVSAAPLVTVDREAHDTLIAVATEGRVLQQDVVLREFARARASLHKAASRIWAGVAGPMAAGLLFLGISGAMLPGAEGFAETHFILNTALVLFLGYGWPILAGWTAVGLWFARAHEGRPATAAKAAA